MRSLLISVATVSLALVLGAAGCEETRPGPPRQIFEVGGNGGEGGGTGAGGQEPICDGPPVGSCGHQVNEIEFNTPNIYFVFDRSGSMAETATGGIQSRYQVVHDASVALVRSLGGLINVGAAVFPIGPVCGAGREVMEITPGDKQSGSGTDGPTTETFAQRTSANPNGGTPISATLNELLPNLAAAEGDTIVMLLTDGGPNCNGAISCGLDECQPNVEGTCPMTENCCSPTHPTGGPELCIDRAASVDGVQAIADLGIPVYVIGITGSEVYEDVLNQMAVAGNTAQANTPTQYHRVDDLYAIGELLQKIAGDAISCELPLNERPTEEDSDHANVYLDCDPILSEPVNGWTWHEGNKILLNGFACAKLKSGQVGTVHIAFGCPTETPK